MIVDTRALRRLQAAHRMHAQLCPLVIAGVVEKKPRITQLNQRAHIGRAFGVELQIADDLVSGRHGLIVWDQEYYSYQDLNSTNGSRVNGVPAQKIRLCPMDKIYVGASVLLYCEDRLSEKEFLRFWHREQAAFL